MIVTPAPLFTRIPFVLGVAYDAAKSPAVLAAIRGGLVHGLVTHTELAGAACSGLAHSRGSDPDVTCRCPAAPPTAAASSGSATPWCGRPPPAGPPRTRCSATLPPSASTARPASSAPGRRPRRSPTSTGRAAVPPLTDDVLTDEALVSVADLLRRYHRAAASFDPAGYAWPRPVPARYRTGLVSHNDVYPANVVFREGRAVALIDFDLAGPGSAVWDFAAAARSFVPLLDEADVTDRRQGRALERFRHPPRGQRPPPRRARCCRGGAARQPRLDLRDRHRGGRRRARRLRRPLARGRPGGLAGQALARPPPARPARRRFVAVSPRFRRSFSSAVSPEFSSTARVAARRASPVAAVSDSSERLRLTVVAVIS